MQFVAEDVPLFLSLIDDLFPGQKADRTAFPEISSALEKVNASEQAVRLWDAKLHTWHASCCAHHFYLATHQVVAERGLQPHPSWLNKCIQLYETYLVRHGIMVVGPTGSGKVSLRGWQCGCREHVPQCY